MTTTASPSSLQVYPSNCQPCRRRKSRCDRIKPCANCKLRGISDECFIVAPRIEERGSSNSSRLRKRSPERSPHPAKVSRPSINNDSSEPTSPPSKEQEASTSSSGLTSWTGDFFQDKAPVADIASSLFADSLASSPPSSAKHDSDRVHWDEIMDQLPSPSLCLQILRFFFDELCAGVSFINPLVFIFKMECFFRRQDTLSRQETALFLRLLAGASLAVPQKHPLRSTFIDLQRGASQWSVLADSFQKASQPRSSNREDKLIDVALHALEAMTCTSRSDFEGCWEATGVAIRKAAALHLFQRPALHSNDPWKEGQQLITTSHMVQKLLVMDRWIAFVDLRPFGVHPFDVTLATGPDTNLRAWLERIQIQLLESARDLLLQYQSSDTDKRAALYTPLRSLLQSIDDYCSQAIKRYNAETPVKIGVPQCAQADSSPYAAVLLSWLAACAFIGCATAMRFSSEASAPSDIRLASFSWANNLLILTPSLDAIYTSGTQALRLSRISNHVFYALRAVVLTLTGTDVRFDSVQIQPHNDALLLESSDWTHGIASGSHQDGSTPPGSILQGSNADPRVLQERFEDSMILLQHFSMAKCKTAMTGLQVMEGMLAQNRGLSEKLGWATAGASSDTTTTATTLTTTISTEPPLSQSETADLSLLWQPFSDDTFLSSYDVESLLASFTNSYGEM